jgi:polyferredoxin
MFEEDPFDRFCRIIMACMVFITHMTELIIRLSIQWLAIKIKYLLVFTWLRTHSFCFTLYHRYFYLWLVFLGFKKPLSWTEIEAFRLKVIAQGGKDIPLSPDLEEGLRQEQEQLKGQS